MAKSPDRSIVVSSFSPSFSLAHSPAMPTATVLPKTVIVHPLVLLSVVDHYNRAAKNTRKRVVGVLLGQATAQSINVANCYASAFHRPSQHHRANQHSVPFDEDEKDASIWFLDHNYLEAMFDMFRKINGTPVAVSVT
jgi:26S proteasome regulatory subunit N8